jgi:hypothetical protein
MTLQPIPCEQADPALLAPYHNLKDRQLRAREGRFIAEGLEVVRRLLISRHEVCSVLATPNKLAALAGQLRPDVPAIAADLDTLLAITGFNVHRGVLACGRRPQNPNLHDAAAALPRQDTSLIVALEEVRFQKSRFGFCARWPILARRSRARIRAATVRERTAATRVQKTTDKNPAGPPRRCTYG